ncbi:MAG: hypothetical protein II341_04995 [Oscillospiraceae bacterium]|nr:hypothetical protein [Oscillospiraceae bacterium]
MNMRDEIKNAFDSVHAPDELAERLKQELYQKDCHEEIEEICIVEEAPRRRIGHYAAYIAAALALCIGCGFSIWSLRDNTSPLNPSTTVPVMTTAAEETTETTSDEELHAAEAEVYQQMLAAHAMEQSRQTVTKTS